MTIVKQMKELDFTPKFLVLLRGSDGPAWAKNLGTAGDYTLLGTGWHAALKYPLVKELNETYTRKHNRLADPVVGPGFAVVQIFADAVSRAGALDRDKIRDAIAATNMVTVSGPLRFRRMGRLRSQGYSSSGRKGRSSWFGPKMSPRLRLHTPRNPLASDSVAIVILDFDCRFWINRKSKI